MNPLSLLFFLCSAMKFVFPCATSYSGKCSCCKTLPTVRQMCMPYTAYMTVHNTTYTHVNISSMWLLATIASCLWGAMTHSAWLQLVSSISKNPSTTANLHCCLINFGFSFASRTLTFIMIEIPKYIVGLQNHIIIKIGIYLRLNDHWFWKLIHALPRSVFFFLWFFLDSVRV